MKKGQHAEGIVQKVLFPNKGVVITEEGERVIVKNTIPGQRVSFAVNKARKGKYEARLLEVLAPSPMEQEAPCPHFGSCGGCTYQSLSYEKQLKLKEEQVRELISNAVKDTCAYEFLPIKASPTPFAYRNKMEFSFGDEYLDGPLALGMHKRGSFYDLVTVRDCRIVDADFRAILSASLDFFSGKEIPYFHRLRHVGYLRHLLVRKAAKTGEILVDLITTTQPVLPMDEKELLAGFAECLCNLPLAGTIRGILHTKNDSVADVVTNEGTEILYGEECFYEELLGLRFRISPFSFFQTNSLGAEVLYETAREFVMESFGQEASAGSMNGATIFDLYSGTGTIAQMMAPACGHVVGVEIVEEAVEAARANAKLNGLSNCEFLAGDVLKVLDDIKEKPDYIILDPPRDGIHPRALEKIIAYNVPNLVYISCKPTSLARDLEVFLARGYMLQKVQCVDMFPWTANVETVVLLSKGVVDKDNYRKVKVDFSLEDMDLTELRGKATYAQIKEYILNEFGLKVSSLYIVQVKKKCGIETGENHNLPNSEDARQPQVTPEKEDAIMKAFRHFGII